MNAIDTRRENIRKLIASAKGRFASVEFVKKDGTLRTLQVQPAAAKFHVLGDKASARAQQATKARKENNPHNLAVWDVIDQCFKTVDLDTVLAVTVDKTRYAVVDKVNV